MTLAAKQRLVVAALAVLAAWPLAHRAVVARYGLDPWRFFGWAMYCTPKLPVRIELRERRAGAVSEIATRDLPRDARRAASKLKKRRALWGTLASPAGLAAALAASRPDAEGFEIVVERWYLDPATAHIATRRHAYQYPVQ
jgi:hypothetical protein